MLALQYLDGAWHIVGPQSVFAKWPNESAITFGMTQSAAACGGLFSSTWQIFIECFQTLCHGAESMKMNSIRFLSSRSISKSSMESRHITDKCCMLRLVIREAYVHGDRKPRGRVLQGRLPRGGRAWVALLDDKSEAEERWKDVLNRGDVTRKDKGMTSHSWIHPINIHWWHIMFQVSF